MKKIIMLVFTFITLLSLTACSNSPEEIYGYWKSEKKLDTRSNTPELFIISDHSIKRNEKEYTNITLENRKNIWTSNEVEQYFGVPLKFGFKLLNKDTLEIFTVIDEKIEHRGIYKKTTEEDIKKILSSKENTKLKSHSDPF